MHTRRQHAQRSGAGNKSSDSEKNKLQLLTTGLHYPLFPSNPLLRRCHATVDYDCNKRPKIDVAPVFANPNGERIYSSIVVIGRNRFLVFGYYDAALDMNLNILEACSAAWHGEVIAFSLGRRVRVHARPGPRSLVAKAVKTFTKVALETMVFGDNDEADNEYVGQADHDHNLEQADCDALPPAN